MFKSPPDNIVNAIILKLTIQKLKKVYTPKMHKKSYKQEYTWRSIKYGHVLGNQQYLSFPM